MRSPSPGPESSAYQYTKVRQQKLTFKLQQIGASLATADTWYMENQQVHPLITCASVHEPFRRGTRSTLPDSNQQKSSACSNFRDVTSPIHLDHEPIPKMARSVDAVARPDEVLAITIGSFKYKRARGIHSIPRKLWKFSTAAIAFLLMPTWAMTPVIS